MRAQRPLLSPEIPTPLLDISTVDEWSLAGSSPAHLLAAKILVISGDKINVRGTTPT